MRLSDIHIDGVYIWKGDPVVVDRFGPVFDPDKGEEINGVIVITQRGSEGALARDIEREATPEESAKARPAIDFLRRVRAGRRVVEAIRGSGSYIERLLRHGDLDIIESGGVLTVTWSPEMMAEALDADSIF